MKPGRGQIECLVQDLWESTAFPTSPPVVAYFLFLQSSVNLSSWKADWLFPSLQFDH